MRRWLIVLAGMVAAAQAPRPAFDAVSVKVNTAKDGLTRVATFPTRFSAVNATLHMLIRYAFDVPDYRLSGGPTWMDSDRFDIAGAAGHTAEFEETRAMARTMLEDRFALRTHVERRDQPIFVLTIARRDGTLGDQMARAGEGCKPVTPPPGAPPPPPAPPAGAAPRAPGCPSIFGLGGISARKIPMSLLVANLSSYLNRHIVDQTNLAGTFDVDLRWTPDQLPQGPPGAPIRIMPFDPNGPSLSTALQEQLGLKFESLRGPVDVLVIDGVSKPSSD
jgi:uncharacterized protein (TIGR03435 family)